MRLAQHLEAVADPHDRATALRVVGDRIHHGREARDRAGAEVVAVREAPGDHDGVHTLRGRIAVPEHLGRRAERLDGPRDIELAVRAREHDHTDARAHVIVTS